MMKLFLTSAIGATIKKDGKRCTGKIDNRYGFLTLFKKQLKRADRMLYIAAIYNDQTRIDAYFKTTIEALKNENIQFRENILINGTAPHNLDYLLAETDVVFLAGGHLPTQNHFFLDIELGQKLQNYRGIIVAQSAGSMNCASNVYVCPEFSGEAIDPAFQRHRPGLGLTDLNIIPHYNTNRYAVLDGFKFYEEVVAPDTHDTPLFLLTDGSFFYLEDQKTPEAYGEIYIFKNRKISAYARNAGADSSDKQTRK